MPSPESSGGARGWGLVGLLVAAYAVSFLDRGIITLLIEDIQRDLAIGDTQIGLLQGPAFGLVYAVMGLPLGWLADRAARLRLIAAGIAMWTLMTMLCGLAPSFGWLFVSRMGVGVGEAALVPAAVSLLADSFPPDRRALPLAVFTSGIAIGAGLALVGGGALVGLGRDTLAAIPVAGGWLASQAGWRAVMILAGAAGLPLSLVFLLLAEPARRETVTRGDPAVSLRQCLSGSRRLFACLLGATTLLYVLSNAYGAWMPALFIRAFGWSPAAAGVRLGMFVLVCALVGNLSSGALATWLLRRGRADGPIRIMLGGALALVPAAILGPLASSAGPAQATAAAIYLTTGLVFGIASTALVGVTPASLRGRMMALYLLLGNLAGLGLGPPGVGWLVERVLRRPDGIGQAVALIGIVTALPAAMLLVLARRPYAAQARAIRDARPAF